MKSITVKNYRGDTIVEVMVAAAVVMAALGAGYALSRQGLRQTTDDSLRNQAIDYGQTQIAFIKNAITYYSPGKNQLLDQYKGLPAGFCVLNNGVAKAYDNTLCKTAYQPFTVKNTYSGKIFSVDVSWESVSSTRGAATPQQLFLYYKCSTENC